MKHITIKIDQDMGYTTTYVAYADCDNIIHATGRGRTAAIAAKRAIRLLERKRAHQIELHG